MRLHPQLRIPSTLEPHLLMCAGVHDEVEDAGRRAVDGARGGASLAEQARRGGDPLPRVGDLEAVVDSDDRVVCVTRVTGVQVIPLADVSDEHARREFEVVQRFAAR